MEETCRKNLLASLQGFEDDSNVDMMGVEEAAPEDVVISVQSIPHVGERGWLANLMELLLDANTLV